MDHDISNVGKAEVILQLSSVRLLFPSHLELFGSFIILFTVIYGISKFLSMIFSFLFAHESSCTLCPRSSSPASPSRVDLPPAATIPVSFLCLHHNFLPRPLPLCSLGSPQAATSSPAPPVRPLHLTYALLSPLNLHEPPCYHFSSHSSHSVSFSNASSLFPYFPFLIRRLRLRKLPCYRFPCYFVYFLSASVTFSLFSRFLFLCFPQEAQDKLSFCVLHSLYSQFILSPRTPPTVVLPSSPASQKDEDKV